MDKNLESLKDYMEFLHTHLDLTVTIHSASPALKNVIYKIPSYNIHSNEYCLCIKSYPEMWDKCIHNQKKIYEHIIKNDFKPFFGSCYAGVGEFIVPINEKENLYGFISVGGYKGIVDKKNHICEKYLLNKNQISESFSKNLSDNIPDINLIQTVIHPICAMLLLEIKDKPPEWYSETEKTLHSALEYVHRNYESKISLCDTASHCHCSSRTLSEIFKKETGMSVCGYIERLRMEKARKLLRSTNISVTEASFLCGFSDANYFSARFSNYYKMSPTKFRIKES